MDAIEAGEIKITAIHDVVSAGMREDFVEDVDIGTSPVVTRINVGMEPRRSSSVCIFTADLVERKCAQGNRLRQRSMVVESKA